ncbi:MAG: hypothetical protein WCF51_08315, partial [Nitrosomonadaceae bacterium]
RFPASLPVPPSSKSGTRQPQLIAHSLLARAGGVSDLHRSDYFQIHHSAFYNDIATPPFFFAR